MTEQVLCASLFYMTWIDWPSPPPPPCTVSPCEYFLLLGYMFYLLIDWLIIIIIIVICKSGFDLIRMLFYILTFFIVTAAHLCTCWILWNINLSDPWEANVLGKINNNNIYFILSFCLIQEKTCFGLGSYFFLKELTYETTVAIYSIYSHLASMIHKYWWSSLRVLTQAKWVCWPFVCWASVLSVCCHSIWVISICFHLWQVTVFQCIFCMLFWYSCWFSLGLFQDLTCGVACLYTLIIWKKLLWLDRY